MKFIAIVGSRVYPHRNRVAEFVVSIHRKYPDAVIVSGGASGVDSWAEERARQLCLGTLVFPANWGQLGKRAGFVRNAYIVEIAETIVGFWDGKSAGTAHTLQTAFRAGKEVFVVINNGPVERFDPEKHMRSG